jgi:flagellar assembly protein FliH
MNLFTDMNSAEKKKPHKFMFDLNIFDEDYIEEPEEPEEPPPPTFSEEELEAAKKEAYDRGRQDARREEKESREQFIAAQLEVVASTLPQIFKEEDLREKRYEEEVLQLAGNILKKLFPVFNERHGLEEVLDVIGKIVNSQENQSKVKIEVAEDIASDLHKHLEKVLTDQGRERTEIIPVQDIGPGSCRVSWKDGGAVRDAITISQKIEESLVQLLAARGEKLVYSVESDEKASADKEASEETESIQPQDDGEEE